MRRGLRTLIYNLALFQVFLYAYVVMETAELESDLFQLAIYAAWLWLIVTFPLTLVAALFTGCLFALQRVVGLAWLRGVALTLTAGVAAFDILSRGSLEDAPQLVTYGLYGFAVRLPGQPLGPLPIVLSGVGVVGWGALVGLVRPGLF